MTSQTKAPTLSLLLLLPLLVLAYSTVPCTAFFQATVTQINCTIPFHLDADSSLYELSGVVTEPVEGLLTSNTEKIGAVGVVEVIYEAQDVCPSGVNETYEAIQDAVKNGKMSIRAPRMLQFYPALLSAGYEGAVGALWLEGVGYGIQGVFGGGGIDEEAMTTPLVSEYEVDLNVRSVMERAWVGSVEPGIEINIEGNQGMKDVKKVQVSMSTEGDLIKMDLLGLTVDVGVVGPIIGDANGSVASGIAQLKGDLISKAAIGCSPKCGVNGHGKCGVNGLGDFTCFCECGWTGEDCDEPKGFCPTFTDQLFDVSDTCEGQYALNPSTRECTSCKPGWEGALCDSCASDQSCHDFWGNTDMQCLKTPEFQERTQFKVFSCDLSAQLLRSFVGNYLVFACNTTGIPDGQEQIKTGKLEDSLQPGPWCEMSLKWENITPMRCLATKCDFAKGSTEGYCAEAVCECNDGEPCTGEAGELFGNGVTDISLVCTERSEQQLTDCKLEFGSLSGLKIDAPCFASECFDPYAPITLYEGGIKGAEEESFRSEMILLGTPLYVIVFLALLLWFPTSRFQKRLTQTPVEDVAASTWDAHHMEKAEIILEHLSCSVPKRKTAEERDDEGGVLRKLSAITTVTDDGEGAKPKNPLPQLKGLTHEVIDMLQPPSKGYKKVLLDVSATFTTGELVAIMGPSGCGKSTFLSVLSGMSLFGKSQQLVTGKITVNGRKRGSWIRKIAVFVPQEDHIMPMLTVRECLTYSAMLRLPLSYGTGRILNRVYTTMSELGLERIANSQVGGVLGVRGISGGERRRVTIGMEMVTKPQIILMDEPTSGLDSHTALSLIAMLKTISQHGRLVMLSVHQPSQAIFSKLSKILLLAHGFPIFLGGPNEVDGYFKRYGRPVPRGSNAAEHMLAVVSRPRTLVPLLNAIFCPNNRAEQGSQNGGVPRKLSFMEPGLNADVPPGDWAARKRMVFRKRFRDIQVMFWRGFVDIMRNPVLLMAHWCMAIVMGLGLGCIFFDVKFDFPGAQNRLGGFFFCLAFLAFTSTSTVDIIHAERTVVLREVKAGYYHPLSYLVAKVLLDAVLLRIIPAILVGVPYYLLAGLEMNMTKALTFLFAACVFNVTVGAFSMTIAMLILNSGAASLVTNILILISLLFSNFPANAETITIYLSWIRHLSFIGYALRIMTINEIRGSSFTIEADNLPTVDVNSDAVLSILGFDPDRFMAEISIIIVLCFLSMIVFCASLSLRNALVWLFSIVFAPRSERMKRLARCLPFFSQQKPQTGEEIPRSLTQHSIAESSGASFSSIDISSTNPTKCVRKVSHGNGYQ